MSSIYLSRLDKNTIRKINREKEMKKNILF